MSQPYGLVAKTIQSLVSTGSHQAIKFLTPKSVIKVTRRSYQQKKPRATDPLDFVVTIGKPAWLEREFAKKLVKAGEPFPVKKVLLRPYPKKRHKD